MTSMRDVAGRAGVSNTLVSRVLNNKKGVSAESKDRILKAIKELNYRPNGIARSLTLHKTDAVGIVMDSFEPFFTDFLDGVSKVGEDKNYSVLFCQARCDLAIKDKYVKYFTNHRVDGIIIYGSWFSDEEIIKGLVESNFPFVLIENHVKDLNVNNILIDNFGGSYIGCEHLIKLGYKKIAYFTGDMKGNITVDRLHGFVKAMNDYKITVYDEMTIEGIYSEESGYDKMKEMLNKGIRPDAICFASDIQAYGGMRAIYEFGLTVPQDIAIVGFDDDLPSRDVDARFPRLTTLKQPVKDIGLESMKLLIEIINNPQIEPKTITYSTKLLIRESSILK